MTLTSDQTERLKKHFLKPPRPSQLKFAEAYLRLAEIDYRPAAPGDGMGSVNLTAEEADDPDILAEEAVAYATKMREQDDNRTFWLGGSNFRTNNAFVFTIEAARNLASGSPDELALQLLEMAIAEIKSSRPQAE